MKKIPYGFLPIPALLLLMIAVFFLAPPSVYYDPAWLILFGNTIFIGAICFLVAFIAFRNYRAKGGTQVLLLGCGVLTFGIGGVVASAVRSVPGVGANLNVTIYNIGALAGALFHLAAALVLLAGLSVGNAIPRRWRPAVGYGAAALFMAAVTLASLKGLVPVFFVQRVGPTPLRQWVLGTADVLFIFSALIFMGTYIRNRERFLYWYACALALTAISLTAFFIEHSVGSPVGWVGRFSQYVGGVYFLVALSGARRSAEARRTSLDAVLSASLTAVEETFRALAENVPDAIRRFDGALRHVYVNPAGLRLLGQSARSVVGRTLRESGYEKGAARLWEGRIEEVFRSGAPIEVEEELPTGDGKRWLQSHCVPEFGPDGRVANVLVISRDLTRHREDEAKIRRQNVALQGIGRILTEAIRCETEEDLAGTCLDVAVSTSGSAFGFIGAIEEDGLLHALAVSDPGWDQCSLVTKTGRAPEIGAFPIRGLYGRALADGRSLLANDPFRHPDSHGVPAGHPPLTSFLGVPLKDRGRTSGMIAVANRPGGYRSEELEDLETLGPIVMEAFLRKRAETELRHHRERLEDLVRARTAELETRNELLTEEIAQRRRAEDENRSLESQLLQAQKMEALGRFAAGIAHDLNNILYPIIIDAESLLHEAWPGTAAEAGLRQILQAAHRQKELVKQILAFSRRAPQRFDAVSVVPLVRETVDLLRASLPSRIGITLAIDAPADVVLGDATQIQQILVNLFRNAADAIGPDPGTIEMAVEDADLAPGPEHPELKAGRYLRLSVTDSGQGMSPEIMERIFEPFFTTKDAGRGSGMGLAVVHGILKHHGGAVGVRSEIGKGSTFSVVLPLTEKDPGPQPPEPVETPPVAGRTRILLVDDEEVILTSLQAALRRLGYAVVAVSDGLQACERFRSDPGGFNLVITDLTMPGITGLELADRLLSARPDIPIILCTGFSDVVNAGAAESLGVRVLLTKPATIGELRSAIGRALGAG